MISKGVSASRAFDIESEREKERGGDPRWLMAVTVARQLLLLAPFFFPKEAKSARSPLEGEQVSERAYTHTHIYIHTHTSLIVESCDRKEKGGVCSTSNGIACFGNRTTSCFVLLGFNKVLRPLLLSLPLPPSLCVVYVTECSGGRDSQKSPGRVERENKLDI